MINITFYSKENCSICNEGLSVLQMVAEDIPMNIEIVDIYKDDQLLEKYQIMIPVVVVDGVEIDSGILSYIKIKEKLTQYVDKN